MRLRDVLKHAGVDVNDPESAGIEHVQFEGESRRFIPRCSRSCACIGFNNDDSVVLGGL